MRAGIHRAQTRTLVRGGALRTKWLGGLICGWLTVTGCATWREATPKSFELPTTRMSPDSVAMEITFVRVPAGQPAINEKLWEHVDEQQVPVAMRRHLNNNGFRCGLVGVQLPSELRDLLDQQSQSDRLDQAVNTGMDVLAQNRRVQSRAGQRAEVVTSSPREEIVVLHKDPAGVKVGGKSFGDAQCILATRSFPQGNGAVRLELTPEVHHGAQQQQFIPGEGTFQVLWGREREVFRDLLIDVTLTPGQTLLLSCTPDQKGLGQNFFVESGRGDAQQKLLLIRLIQTQRDDLFDPPPTTSAGPSTPAK
jgi:hypothetical protein